MDSCIDPVVTVYSPICMQELPLLERTEANGIINCTYHLNRDYCGPLVTLRFQHNFNANSEEILLCEVQT